MTNQCKLSVKILACPMSDIIIDSLLKVIDSTVHLIKYVCFLFLSIEPHLSF